MATLVTYVKDTEVKDLSVVCLSEQKVGCTTSRADAGEQQAVNRLTSVTTQSLVSLHDDSFSQDRNVSVVVICGSSASLNTLDDDEDHVEINESSGMGNESEVACKSEEDVNVKIAQSKPETFDVSGLLPVQQSGKRTHRVETQSKKMRLEKEAAKLAPKRTRSGLRESHERRVPRYLEEDYVMNTWDRFRRDICAGDTDVIIPVHGGIDSSTRFAVYLRSNDGFLCQIDGRINLVVRALYGLRQSGRKWNSELNRWLFDHAYQRLTTEPCLYYQFKENDIMLDQGLLTSYLGIEVKQTGDHITIRQSKYTRDILETFGYENEHAVGNPMETNPDW
ncbi:Integrase catalytic core protein [Phytophthora palmivora]|uniref:Integrase catalytic core protein n=1 Tax=Phytophthora palmivora TaxID=4796 RepID=A0A2P4X298_9STRA|nr:Integrase catalytic core protein [Phytophthora palmivora]